MAAIHASAFVHETAIIESGVAIGANTAVWDHAHIRRGAHIGHDCIVGDKTYIGPDVRIGALVKLNTSVYVCTGVTLERGVMIAAHVVFTNDRYPRAADAELQMLRSSAPDDDTLDTHVREGATIGAAAVVGPGIEIGRFAMVGMGSVVTRSVPAFNLVVGNPAAIIGVVCRCGHRLSGIGGTDVVPNVSCDVCGRRFSIDRGSVTEATSAQRP